MEERASGIILRTRSLTETSIIAHLLTQDQGRLAVVAKGARRPKSPFIGKLDLFYEAEISFSRSRKSDLHNLREIKLLKVHSEIRRDLSRLNAAAYAAVLIELGTETETPIPEFYDLFLNALEALDNASPTEAFVFGLELKFLAFSGALPSFETLSGAARQVVTAYETLPLAASDSVPAPEVAKRELSAFFRRAIGTLLERLPPQRERLLESLKRTF